MLEAGQRVIADAILAKSPTPAARLQSTRGNPPTMLLHSNITSSRTRNGISSTLNHSKPTSPLQGFHRFPVPSLLPAIPELGQRRQHQQRLPMVFDLRWSIRPWIHTRLRSMVTFRTQRPIYALTQPPRMVPNNPIHHQHHHFQTSAQPRLPSRRRLLRLLPTSPTNGLAR